MEAIREFKITPHFEKGAWIPGRTLKIYVDNDPLNPRKEWDNLGTMVCFHRRYDLGDNHSLRADDFSGWDEIEEYLIREKDAVVILPVYMYDHSGIVLNTSGFSCPWDSGQVGFIYVSKSKIEEEYGQDTRENRDIARRVLEGEVEEYSKYLSGDVYGYKVFDEEEDEEEIDSCWGYYDIKYILEDTGFSEGSEV